MDDWFGLQRGLVAVGLLAVVPGCPSDKDKTTESTGTDPGSTGSTGDTGGTSGGTTGGTSGDTPTGSGSATDSGTGEPTTGEPTTSGTTGDATTGDATTGDATTGGPALPPECVSYGAKIAECYMDPRAGMAGATYCGETHAYYEMNYGADCVQAFEAAMACISALSCAEFLGDLPEDCKAAFDAIAAVCV